MDPAVQRHLRADFGSLEEYSPVKPLDVLAAEIGVPVGELVKLDANENLYGPVAAVREAIASAPVHIYPDPGQAALREAIAEYAGVTPAQVVAGAGADDLIDIILRVVMPTAVASATPTFGMYGFLAKVARAALTEVPRGPAFAPDVHGLRAAVAQGAGIVFLTSPNNPTGNSLSLDEAEALCQLDAIVVIDEAYIEFGGTTMVPLLARYPNLLILRTFSKWAGLAGLRVGYGLCHPDLAGAMMAVKQPYNVNVASDYAARAALDHRGEVLETVRLIVAERDRMARLLGDLGWLVPLPSDANFVLFDVLRHDAKDVAGRLRRQGVLVRHYDRPDLSRFIRISAGRPEDTDRLVEALKHLEDA